MVDPPRYPDAGEGTETGSARAGGRSLRSRLVLLGVVVLVGHECERFEHNFESFTGIAGLVPDFGEMFEVAADLTFVPRNQDALDVREVLVQRRTPDAGLFGDL